jgi:hypothetical protein
MILHVVRAEHVGGHRVRLWFNDGTDGEVDLWSSLDGPIFEPLKNIDYFKQICLEGHTLAWKNGADFAPEYLRELIEASAAA